MVQKLKNSPTHNTTGNTNTGHYWGTTTTGTGITINPNSPIWMSTSTNNKIWTDGNYINSDIVEYIDIFYQFMGIDMDYKRFSEMSKEEKKGFIRDLKLKKIIED